MRLGDWRRFVPVANLPLCLINNLSSTAISVVKREGEKDRDSDSNGNGNQDATKSTVCACAQ